MAMKRLLILLALAISCLSICEAQTVADVTKNINKVKRDTMYIYAEATMKDLNEAYNGARAILEMKVGDWVREQHPEEGIEVCIVKAKEHFIQLETRRGDFYRAFVYVRKSDIMPVADKSEVTVFEVAPVVQPNQAQAAPAIIISEDAPIEEKKAPILELTSEEKQMKQVRSFYEVEPYIKGLKSKDKLIAYGKYATMPENEDCHLFVYDKQGNISALLRKTGDIQYNLNTLKEDNVKNYKNCGAIWFQLK
jgi:hypothetical protein